MTKLGTQPGVHGGEDLEKEAIKIDPKVFTVLQPTVIPMPAAPPKPAPSAAYHMMRACFHCIFFATCLLLVTMLGFYFLAATPELFRTIDSTNTQKPQMEALISNKVDEKDVMAIPLARVVVVEDISSPNQNQVQNQNQNQKTVVDGSVEDKTVQNSVTNLDRPLHPDEIEQYRMMEARQQFQQMMEERMWMQQMMAMRMMRMRRLQAAYYQQQQMKMAYMQQQQQAQEEQAARQQWAERARYEEEQRRQWEAQQAYAQQQRAQAFWQQHQMEMAQQQAQMMQQHQQRPTVWQQPPQQFWFPGRQEQGAQQAQGQGEFFPQQPAPQPSVHDKIYEELQKKSQNIPVNAPTRQIWTAITPTPAPINSEATVSTVTTTQMPDAAEVSDTILRDIFSAFDEQKNSEAANKELTTTEEPELEGKGAIVIEDSFPRIEERTTTPEPEESDEDLEMPKEDVKEHEKELDPFAAVLKFFENNPPRGVVEASTEKPVEKPLII